MSIKVLLADDTDHAQCIRHLLKRAPENRSRRRGRRFQSNRRFDVSIDLAEDCAVFFEYSPMPESVNMRREIRLPTQQCLDAFEDMLGFGFGTNSLEPRLSGFVA